MSSSRPSPLSSRWPSRSRWGCSGSLAPPRTRLPTRPVRQLPRLRAHPPSPLPIPRARPRRPISPTHAGPGRWVRGPRCCAAGSRPRRSTGRGIGAWTSRRPRVRRYGPPRRGRSPSRARWRGAGSSRSPCPAPATLRCVPPTSRWNRWSGRVSRSLPAKSSRCCRPALHTARRPVCTGGCSGAGRIWIRCRSCRPPCCAGARPGCCRCSGCRNRGSRPYPGARPVASGIRPARRGLRGRCRWPRFRPGARVSRTGCSGGTRWCCWRWRPGPTGRGGAGVSPVRRAAPWRRPPRRSPGAPRPRPVRCGGPPRPPRPGAAWRRAGAARGPARRGLRRSWR